MDTKEKHIRENESIEKKEARMEKHDEENLVAGSLRADARNKSNMRTRKTNRMWLWFGVLILIFILLWWLYSIGTFEDLIGVANG